MLFGEMLDEERKEGRQEILSLMKAMIADDKSAELPRLQSEPQFLVDMLEHYGMNEQQIII